jgi:folate-binding protein YgfZ
MGYFSLSPVILSIGGRHAERYLQARLTNDVRLSSPTKALAIAALTPQGKTEAFGRLLRSPSGGFLLIIDGGAPVTIAQAVSRFKVAEQVEIKVEEDLAALHLFGADAESIVTAFLGSAPLSPEDGNTLALSEAPLTALTRRRRTTSQGLDLIAPTEKVAQIREKLQCGSIPLLSPEEQEALRLEAGIPAFPNDLNEAVILSEVGAEDAISFTKGCYTGQEVIAKIDALGKPPRRLTRLTASGSHQILSGTAVTAAGKVVGKVTSAAFHRGLGQTLLFALLKNDGADYPEGLNVGDIPCSLAER